MTSQDVFNRCDSTLNKYKDAIEAIKWSERSILLSEGLLVCAMADLFNIELFVESGVYEGKSAEVWGRYFLNKNVDILAIDAVIRNGARKRLSYLPNVKLLAGDGVSVLPSTVNTQVNKKRNVGVFIDGPKGEVAVNLAKKLIVQDNVKFVAVHDCHKLSFGLTNYTRTALEKYEGDKFFSDSPLFVEKYGYLDTPDIGKLDKGQRTRWYPGRLDVENKDTRHLGSHGPTVGVII